MEAPARRAGIPIATVTSVADAVVDLSTPEGVEYVQVKR
jgi:hypothetical protein